MDWGRTKTIFIVTFFILNLFLGYQLYQKQSNNRFEYMSESAIELEDELKNAGITYGELPEVPKKLSHVIGETYVFTSEELRTLEKEELKITRTDDGGKVYALFEEAKTTISTEMEAQNIVDAYCLFGDEYIYSEALSKKDKNITYIQTYDGRPIYQKEDSINGQITIQLDSEDNIVGFAQTYLQMNEEGSEKDILSSLKAINQLHNKNKLKQNDTITHIELGYYSLIEGKVQVLAPTWLIEVNEERYYYVNAINGLIDDPNVEAHLKIGDENYELNV